MKVVIVTTIVPFVRGGDRAIVSWLETALAERGHEVETFRIPNHPAPAPLLAQLVGLRSLDFTDSCDRLIAIRTPSYVVRHPSKVVWFIHHRRPSYDLWETEHRDMPRGGDGWEYRRLMFASDEVALNEARAVFTNSEVMTDRLRDYNGIDATTLYPPLPPDHGIRPGPFGDYAVTVSRLVDHKRPRLAIESLAKTRTAVKLVLAGNPSTAGYGNELREHARRLGIADRVTVRDEWISDDLKRKLLGESLAVLSLPIDEDSYSYAALEGATAAKPIITTSDSGGVLELVRDGINGMVRNPDPDELAEALDALYVDRHMAARQGDAQAGILRELGLDWDHVVGSLLA